MKHQVVVAGDLVWDFHLQKNPALPTTHHEMITEAILHRIPGGAWYTGNLIQSTIPDSVAGLSQPKVIYSSLNESVSQAFQVWELFRQNIQSKQSPSVWRISQFLGCQKPVNPKDSSLPEDNPSNPDVLVLDNLNLGFFELKYRTLAALSDDATPDNIILKLSSLRHDTEFLNFIFNQKYTDHLAIVLSARALRDRGAKISQGLSWDRTIEETTKEFKVGASAADLRKCRRVVVTYSHEGAAYYEYGSMKNFLYHPREHEGDFIAKRPGRMFGTSSIFAAAMVRHIMNPVDFPAFIALGRALAAARANHDIGGGSEDSRNKKKGTCDPDAANDTIKRILCFDPANTDRELQSEPADIFATAFDHSLLWEEAYQKQESKGKVNLLQDFTGVGNDYMAAIATDVVLRGTEKALSRVPMAKYGSFTTADREEIERINSLRNLIVAYRNNVEDQNPLSIAVFGPPGSGKSFAIKQLSKELFGSEMSKMEFNLSQMQSIKELHVALHMVRDASVRGKIPLVFWDEFDSQNLKWLKEFLAPMQDAEFTEGSIKHPLGKAIFVFAGGIYASLEKFNQKKGDFVSEKDGITFGNLKGPDFVSRLRGYLNIKGPNPAKDKDRNPRGRQEFIIRRAILLRCMLERSFPGLIDPATGNASVSASVINGFLRVEKYEHGARSLEAVIKMSNLMGSTFFGAADLPSIEMLKLHVTKDFLDEVKVGQIQNQIIETIAEKIHNAWKKHKESDGWTYGTERNDGARKHPWLLPYHDPKLPEEVREGNRKPARLTLAKLHSINCRITKKEPNPSDETPISEYLLPEDREMLIKIEHDIWLRDHLLAGYSYAENTNESLRQHRCISAFDQLIPEDRDLDSAIVDAAISALAENGYEIEKDTT